MANGSPVDEKNKPEVNQPAGQSRMEQIVGLGQQRQRDILLQNNPNLASDLRGGQVGTAPTLGQLADTSGKVTAGQVQERVGTSPVVGAGITGLPPTTAAAVLGAAPRGGITPGPIARGDAPAINLADFDSPLTTEEVIKSGLVTGKDRRTLFQAQGSRDSKTQREAARILNNIEQKRQKAVQRKERDEQRAFEKTVREDESKLRTDEAKAKTEAATEGQLKILGKQEEIQTASDLATGKIPIDPETGELSASFKAKYDADIQKLAKQGDIQSIIAMNNAFVDAMIKSGTTTSRQSITPAGDVVNLKTETDVALPEGTAPRLPSEVVGVDSEPVAGGQNLTSRQQQLRQSLLTGKTPNGKPMTPEAMAQARKELGIN